MTYLSDKKRTRRNYKYYFVVVVLFFLIVYFWPSFRTSTYTNIETLAITYSKIKNGLLNIPQYSKLYFSSRKNLEREITNLELTVERLENEVAKNNITVEKISDDGSQIIESNVLVIYPIMRDITGIYSTVLFSKGFKDGVEKDSLVYDKTSLCKLLSGSQMEVEGVTKDEMTLFLKGDGGGTFIVDIPTEMNLAKGDILKLKSNPSLVLGTVTDIFHDEKSSSFRVYIRGAYNPVTSSIFYIDK